MSQPISDIHTFRSFLYSDRGRFDRMCREFVYLAKDDDISTPVKYLYEPHNDSLRIIHRVTTPIHRYYFDITPHIIKLQRKLRAMHA